MLGTTIDACKAIIKTDPSVTPVRLKENTAFLRNGANHKSEPPTAKVPALPAIVRPAQAAVMLGRSVRSIHALCTQGLLKKATWPGRARAAGITQSSLTALLNASNGDAQ